MPATSATPTLVSRAVRGIDEVHHLAFVNGTEFFYNAPDLVLDVGVRGMINVIDACRRQGVRHAGSGIELRSLSDAAAGSDRREARRLSCRIRINPRYSYGAGKIISEVMAINYGRKYFDRVLIFRPHNVYGPDMGFEHVIPQFALRMKKPPPSIATGGTFRSRFRVTAGRPEASAMSTIWSAAS